MTERDADREARIATALDYHRRGWAVIPVRYRGKEPLSKDWPNLHLDQEEIREAFSLARNIGILEGEPSGHRVNIDCDAVEAEIIAAALMPTTACYGRTSRPKSHYIVISPGTRSTSFKAPGIGTPVEACSRRDPLSPVCVMMARAWRAHAASAGTKSLGAPALEARTGHAGQIHAVCARTKRRPCLSWKASTGGNARSYSYMVDQGAGCEAGTRCRSHVWLT